MGRWGLLIFLVLTRAAQGQELPDAPVSKATWTTFAGLGTEIVADGVMTRVLYQRGHEEIDPLAKPFVRAGVPGQVGASLLGAGAMGGLWFVLHRLHHERAAGWFLRTATAGEGLNVARQAAILRTSQADQAAANPGAVNPDGVRNTGSRQFVPSLRAFRWTMGTPLPLILRGRGLTDQIPAVAPLPGSSRIRHCRGRFP